MPHNRTRIWVGLAIAAVTIPAVGEFYSQRTTPDLLGNPIAQNARLPISSAQPVAFSRTPTASNVRVRDYAAELDATLAQQGTGIPVAGSEEDPTFDVSPYDESYDEDQASEVEPQNGATPQSPTSDDDSLAQGSIANTGDPGASVSQSSTSDGLDQVATDGLSDSAVYSIVLNNLPADQRDDFVRAYAAMSQSQRAEMLEGFRTQIQGDQEQ